jgi:hypothetical protein
MMDRAIKGIFITLGLVVLTSGCVMTRMMYEGEQRPKEQVAIIKGSSKYLYFGVLFVFVTQVDDKSVKPTFPPSTNVNVEVLPGQHTVQVVVWRDVMEFEKIKLYVLDFYALAGHTYRAKASV